MHLRFPKRARGLVLGVLTLVAGPAIAAALTTPPQLGVTTARVTSAIPAAADVSQRARMLRLRTPFASPTPTPTPRPAPKPAPHPRRVLMPSYPVSRSAVVQIILAAAARYGVSGSWMVKIASCESGLNPYSYNPRGPYYGLFQFLMSTFTHNGGTNIWNASDQANIAAKMLAHGQAWQWSCA
jgi:hypothetical protein